MSKDAVQRRAQGRAVLGWALGFFLTIQVALVIGVDQWQPSLRDAQYGQKLALLQTARAKQPTRPLWLMLGSSRTAVGFCPEEAGRNDESAIVFNFGLPAAGPIKQRQCLESLLGRGLRPDRLVVEIMSPLFNEPGRDRLCEENWLDVPGLAANDVWRLRTYVSQPLQLGLAWTRSRALPCYRLRRRILTSLARAWLSPRESALPAGGVDRFGWQRLNPDGVSEEEHCNQFRNAARTYAGAFVDFRVGSGPRRALEDLLERCRRERIDVILVRMPEASAFRAWTLEAESAVDDLLWATCECHAVRLIDARRWIADEDFWDGHHLLPRGARQFTGQLMDELDSE